MNNRWFIIIVLVLLVSCLATGCGISKSQYDAIAAELETVKQERQAAQEQLQTAQSELSEIKLDLQTAQADVDDMQQQLDEKEKQLQSAQTDLQTTQGQLKMAQNNLQVIETQLDDTRFELTQTKIDLQASKAEVKLLQADLDTAAGKAAEVIKYAELIDILMWEVWISRGLTPRFEYLTLNDQKAAAYDKATSTGDTDLLDLVIDLFNNGGEAAWEVMYRLWYYSLDIMENDLK